MPMLIARKGDQKLTEIAEAGRQALWNDKKGSRQMSSTGMITLAGLAGVMLTTIAVIWGVSGNSGGDIVGIVVCGLLALIAWLFMIGHCEPDLRHHNRKLRKALKNGDILDVPDIVENALKQAVAAHLPKGIDHRQVMRDNPEEVRRLLYWASKHDLNAHYESDLASKAGQAISETAELICMELWAGYEAEHQQRNDERAAFLAGEYKEVELELSVVRARRQELLNQRKLEG